MTTWKWRGQPKTTTKRLPLPSQHYLQTHFEYDPETGSFNREDGKWGFIDNTGYTRISIEGKTYLVHRLIWKLVNGVEPNIIDHINRNKLDNRWCNLRNVTQSINCRNKAIQSNSRGIHGVYYWKEREMWYVYITHNKRIHHIGKYHHALEAIQARIEAEEIFWGKSHVHTNLK